MRVVVDTNVLISSFFGGNPKKVIDLWKAGDITLCLSKDRGQGDAEGSKLHGHCRRKPTAISFYLFSLTFPRAPRPEHIALLFEATG